MPIVAFLNVPLVVMNMTPASPARFASLSLDKPRPGLLAVEVTLRDFAIITFAVAPDALAKQLPQDFAPEVFTLTDGSQMAFVSAVTFYDVDFRSVHFPWHKSSFGQTNYRAYVTYKGKRVGWFFGTTLDTPAVLIPRHLWLLPWHRAKMSFETAWQGDICTRYKLNTVGDWGRAEVEIEGTDEASGWLDGFADDEETSVILTHPLDGYYYRRDGKVGTYSIWHDKLTMTRGIAKKASFQVFHDLGLTRPGQLPHSVLLQRTTDFTILLPPRLAD